jgi:hypothetical protein
MKLQIDDIIYNFYTIMKTGTKVFIVPLIIITVFLLFASSCEKEDNANLLFDNTTINELENIVMENMIYQGYEIPVSVVRFRPGPII